MFWVLRFFVWPRPKLDRTPLDYPMFVFFLLTALSSFLSYEPMVSIGKLRAASLFTIVYLFAENIRSPKILRVLAVMLVVACMANVVNTFARLALGKGVKIYGVAATSPLSDARWISRSGIQKLPIVSGDTIEAVDGQPVQSADTLVSALAPASSQLAKVQIYRQEWVVELQVPRARLLPGATAEERLGIERWSKGRDHRATSFFGNWVTYADMLQLIGALTLGLLAALPRKFDRRGLLLGLALVGICGALLLTVTRASWLAFLAASIFIAALSLNRRTLIVVSLCLLPLVLAGVFILRQKRNIGFFDRNDQSTTWRLTVWKEGFHLLVISPRHLLVGIGMDSIKSKWREWGLFENGRLPWGHMHSDYLEIALERGLPAFFAWVILIGTYARMLWRLRRRVPTENWIERGVVLGALGGLLGFMMSGIFQYNWGDSAVMMIFYLLMGLSLIIERSVRSAPPFPP